MERRATHSSAVAASAPSPKASELTWYPLPKHPIFNRHGKSNASGPPKLGCGAGSNLIAWNAAASRLYLWDPHGNRVHRLSLRFGNPDGDDDDSASAVEAAYPSEVMLTNLHINSPVNYVSLNGEGTALLLFGPGGLFVMYVYDRVSSTDDSFVCRTVSVASEVNFVQNDGLRIMHVSWHPHSETHIGVLSSDSVFRLYDLSRDLKQPEQEYYLQPNEPGKSDVTAKSPVAFSFGGEHLWDRFSVFILFSDGSIYVLCPVVPFGCVFGWPSIEEIYEDVNMFGLKSSNTKAISNAWFALSWIEATFPDVVNKGAIKDGVPGLKARPYAPMDASLSLQGPLHKISHCMGSNNHLSLDCNGKALNFLYNSVGKDSVLVIAWSNGQLQIDALADEVQPLWTMGAAPRIRVDSRGRVTGAAMICESNAEDTEDADLVLSNEVADTAWLGIPPPLLSLAIVDLALSRNALNKASLFLFADPIMSKRIYCVHNGGVDSIALHYLPFSSSNLGSNVSPKPPTVYPILGACDSESSRPLLCGFSISVDPFGDSRIIAVTPTYSCIVLEVKQWNDLPLFQVDLDSEPAYDSDTPDIISKEVLSGPKEVLVSESDTLRSLSAESIEGRSALHHYSNLFHQHYVQYAHKVYLELKHHGDHLKQILDVQRTRLHDVNQMLSNFESKQTMLNDRVNKVLKGYMLLERRLEAFRSLPGVKRKPLSRAEREFRTQLERLAGQEMDALHTSVEALKARLRRITLSSGNASATVRPNQGKRNQVPDVHISELKSSIERLSLINSENAKKDLPRTFPNHPWLDSAEAQTSLRRVLVGYSFRDSDVGYCQGLNYVAALLLLVMETEEDTFWMLAVLLENVLVNDCYTDNLSGCHVEQRVFRDLLGKRCPRIAAHLDAMGFDISLVATEWFLCIFAKSLPSETTFRIWDVLFNEGAKVLFPIALAIFKMNEEDLLNTHHIGDAVMVLQEATRHMYDPDELLMVAFDKIGSMTTKTITKQRKKQEPAVMAELDQRLKRVNPPNQDRKS